jgi:hypothetical protein
MDNHGCLQFKNGFGNLEKNEMNVLLVVRVEKSGLSI